MALPFNATPTFIIKVPSTGKSLKYRPFLVKDEKALLIAQQSEDTAVMFETLKSVLTSCILEEVDLEKMALFDIEYIFTHIRAKSVGETIDLLFGCDEDHGELNDKAKVKKTINLIDDVNIIYPEGHTNKFILFQDVGVVMKYPSLETTKIIEDSPDDVEKIFDVIIESIDFIFQGDDIYYAKEEKREELVQFINNLTAEQFVKLQSFFQTMPKLSTTIEYKCPICGKEHKKVLEGLQNFFS